MFARTRRTINSGRSMGRSARHLMQKFRILKPLKTHWRIATCSEVECQAHEKGFRTIVDKNSAQAGYIRGDFKINGFVSGRHTKNKLQQTIRQSSLSLLELNVLLVIKFK